MPYSDVLFFDYTSRMHGLLGYKLCGGANDHFVLNGITNLDCLKIRKFMINHGMRVSSRKSGEGKTFYGSGSLFGKESITVMDDGVAHHFSTSSRNSDSFVPYDKVDFFLISNAKLFQKKLTVVGQLSFSTTQSFPDVAARNLKAELDKKSGKIQDGKVLHPHAFSKTKYKKKTSLILLEDKILYIGPLWELSDDENSAYLKSKTENIITIKKVSEYSCHPLFSMFDRTAWIRGTGSVDMRTGKAAEQTIVFPGVNSAAWKEIKAVCQKLSQ